MEFLVVLRDVAALSASVAVLYGVNTWRRDFIGKRKIEMAEDTLSLFYQASDVIRWMRSPGSFSDESDHIERRDNESREEYAARRNVAPLYKRYESRSELFAKLSSGRYEFMARFGKETGAPFELLRELVNDLLRGGSMLVATARAAGDDADERRSIIEQRRRYENIIWDHFGEDPINGRLDSIVESIESICGEVISAESRFSVYINRSKERAISGWVWAKNTFNDLVR